MVVIPSAGPAFFVSGDYGVKTFGRKDRAVVFPRPSSENETVLGMELRSHVSVFFPHSV